MTPGNDISPHELARRAVETFTTERIVIEPPVDPQGVLGQRAGCFVTLRMLDGRLRGCIGTLTAEYPNVAREIIHNGISAATRDPRFVPITVSELANILYGVDVLSPPERVRGPEDLDPNIYGVVIETVDGRRRGLLLPRISGLETVEDQWLAVHSKVGIEVGTPVLVERFTVTRFGKD